jgi:primosomal protein N' (replication factor Y)
MEERNAFGYPPYSRIVTAIIKGRDADKVVKASEAIRDRLADLFGYSRVLGPDSPPVSKVQYLFIRRIIIKIPLELTVDKSRSMLNKATSFLSDNHDFNGITLYFDADPQ